MLALVRPVAPLRAMVEVAVAVRRDAGTTSHFPAMPRAMLTASRDPGGRVAVVFHGLRTRAVAFEHPEAVDAVGLVLPPLTAARLTAPATGALVDAAVPWAELAGPHEADRLAERLERAGSTATRLAVLQDGLARRLAQVDAVARADGLQSLCAAVERWGPDAAGPMGIGVRQLERRCQALLGVSPKQLQRLTRFRDMLAATIARGRPPDADAALEAGYFDQSHLARDARALAGAPFRELLGQAHPDGAWWPLATQRLAPQGFAGRVRHQR